MAARADVRTEDEILESVEPSHSTLPVEAEAYTDQPRDHPDLPQVRDKKTNGSEDVIDYGLAKMMPCCACGCIGCFQYCIFPECVGFTSSGDILCFSTE